MDSADAIRAECGAREMCACVGLDILCHAPWRNPIEMGCHWEPLVYALVCVGLTQRLRRALWNMGWGIQEEDIPCCGELFAQLWATHGCYLRVFRAHAKSS